MHPFRIWDLRLHPASARRLVALAAALVSQPKILLQVPIAWPLGRGGSAFRKQQLVFLEVAKNLRMGNFERKLVPD